MIIPAFVPTPFFVLPTTMMGAIQYAGLTQDLQFVIDAGEAESYPGSGQTIFDRSGNGYDFQLGDSTGDATNDPAFVGVAGRQSSGEYFEFSPYTEYLRMKTKPAWVDTLHKDNAVFTWASWRRITHDAVNGAILFHTVNSGAPGIAIYDDQTTNKFAFYQHRTDVDITSIAQGPTVSSGNWAFYAISYTEATGAWIARVNATEVTGTNTYVSPSAAAGSAPKIGSTGDNADDDHAEAFWTRALSSAELTALYNATKTKFGL